MAASNDASAHPVKYWVRTMIRRLFPITALLALLFAATPGQGADEGSDKVFEADFGAATVDVSDYPEEMRELYPLYARKCSKCHTLARSINSTYRGDEWDRYVARMSRKPNSGISPGTGDKILTFLKYHFGRADGDDG